LAVYEVIARLRHRDGALHATGEPIHVLSRARALRRYAILGIQGAAIQLAQESFW